MASVKLNLVVAVCNNRGIGMNGTIPWRLSGDMAFFKRITSETKEKDRKNVVIMGRNTWESIPDRFRPLPNRINIVISRTLQSLPNGAHVARSLDEAVQLATEGPTSKQVEDIFIIGGHTVYKLAMQSPHCHRIYLTRVLQDFECDTFMPDIDMQKFRQTSLPDIPSSQMVEKDLPYKFEVYEKIPILVENEVDARRCFSICVAMLDNRGIGKDGTIAWPPLKRDYEYYLHLTSRVSQPAKKCLNIKGRITWEETDLHEKSRPSVINIVVSKSLKVPPAHVWKIANSLEDALSMAGTCPELADTLENIWVMGGQQIYEEAVKSPYCRRIHLTRIHASFACDAFFPEFEKEFHRVRDDSVEEGIFQENGLKFEFQVYERNTR